MVSVAAIGLTYVKSTRFLQLQTADLASTGLRHDRDFALVEADGSFISTERHGEFFPLSFAYDVATDGLRLTLPDGREIEGPAAATGPVWRHDHFGVRTFDVAEVEGPWTGALSDFAGRPVRLARCLHTGMGLDILPITFVGTASILRLEREIGAAVDPARFRPGFVLDTEVEHEEDGWDGRLLRVGAAVLRVRTPVPRCSIPGLDPAKGVRNLDIMKALIRYRDRAAYPDGLLQGYETPGFATYAEVVEPGAVSVGDPVELLG